MKDVIPYHFAINLNWATTYADWPVRSSYIIFVVIDADILLRFITKRFYAKKR